MQLKILENFCSHTNLHGFSYMVQSSRHRVEQIFWFLSIFISLALTGVLIHKLIIESYKNPVVIYTDENAIKIEELNFPAVSISLGLLYKTPCLTVLDYEAVKEDLKLNPKNIKHLTLEQLKLLQIESLVQNDQFLSDMFPNLTIPTDDLMEKLELFDESKMKRLNTSKPYCGIWMRKYDMAFTKFPCRSGVCLTFNMAHLEDIHKEHNILQNFTHFNYVQYYWSMLSTPLNSTYPLKPQQTDHLFHIDFPTNHKCPLQPTNELKFFDFFNYSLPNTERDGFALRFHDPFEVVSKDTTTFYTIQDQRMRMSVIPKVNKIDESLRVADLRIRNCYLKKEHPLKFFKVYTKANCDHECLSEMTMKSCGCTQFFMARNKSTRICGIADEKCFIQVENEFDASKSICRCLEPCESVKYEIKLNKVERVFYRRGIGHSNMEVYINMGTSTVYPQSRRSSYTSSQVLSFVGGILGLFAGFSVLSGFEIVYYFLVHPILSIRRKGDSRVYPINKNANEGSKITKFVKEMLNSSSIHSFSQIGSDGKSFFERVIWALLFTTSIVSTCFMVRRFYQIYNETKIILVMDGSPTKVEDIPFPAFMFVRDVMLRGEVELYEKLSGINISDTKYNNKLVSQLFSLICLRKNPVDPVPFDFKKQTDLVGIIRYYTYCQKDWLERINATWNGVIEPPFAQILSKTIFGEVFNFVEMSKMLHEDLVSSDFHYFYKNSIKYNNSFGFPWRTSVGDNNGLRFEADIKPTYPILSQYDYCIGGYPGAHSMLVFSPFDLPASMEGDTLTNGRSYHIHLEPKITKADESLKAIDPSVRKCYFEGERKLKFFKIYTKSNCENECDSLEILKMCGCVPYNQIRSPDTKVCDFSRIKSCVNDVDSNNKCNCLPQCHRIEYAYDMYNFPFNNKSYKDDIHIMLRWKDNEYYATVRYQQVRLVDFLSHVGGILGLFAGISVLSIVELAYFLSLRLINDLINALRH